ncbi:MAG: rRNA maturation RNase YbeY [Clostridiales bacterium]|jgi:probable rRNA maturation factor|nr:rRNA maturation RNase YbeY [Eubacteriales bacterium]MDH7565334.1 rRNA maturation RNase YbeY [Clostridiales bacterium]
MKIVIENMQDKIEFEEDMKELLLRAVHASFKEEGFNVPSEVSIMLVDNERIREINREQRGIDSPTDVLSFPMVFFAEGEIDAQEGDFDLDENLLLLGDIVISLEMAKKQAEEYGHSFERELAFLTTHGIFHLLGYDHENEEDEETMMGKQEAVLDKMGLGR